MKRRLSLKDDPAKGEPAKTEPVVAAEIVESALEKPGVERIHRAAKCVVCGEQASVDPTEQLCWVCRRLKISAWRDSDHQLPAQE
jgi:hypothetical protein